MSPLSDILAKALVTSPCNGLLRRQPLPPSTLFNLKALLDAIGSHPLSLLLMHDSFCARMDDAAATQRVAEDWLLHGQNGVDDVMRRVMRA